MHFFTCSTDTEKLRAHSEMSARSGLDEMVYSKSYQNHMDGKVKGGLGEALRGKKTTEIVAYLDGWDAMWLCDAAQIEHVYRKRNTGVLISGERYFSCPGCPEGTKEKFEAAFPSSAPHRYLNAGAYVGSVEVLQKYHDRMKEQGWLAWGKINDDQSGWYQFAIENPGLVAIDTDQELSSTVSVPGTCPVLCDTDNPRAMNHDTKHPTCAIHTAGRGHEELLLRKKAYEESCIR